MFVSSVRDQVAQLLGDGLSLNEIAIRIGVAQPTVSYHAARLESAGDAPEPPPREQGPAIMDRARRNASTRQLVAALIEEGLPRAAIARRLGVSKGTVSYHARRLDAPVDERCARRYDWSVIQAYYDLGHSMRECRERFGFSTQSWHAAVQRGAIVPRSGVLALEALLVAGIYRGRSNLKLRLLKEGLKEPRCEGCGISEWRGRPLSLALHHENGDRHDNRLANLRLLCPNCHSQTPNFAGRNGRR
jgi:DNA-binding CsgD family transcriptional regulator